MGMGLGISRSFGEKRRSHYPSGPLLSGQPVPIPVNPDPARYNFLEVKEIGECLLVKINYPNCSNYEGTKILLFKGIKLVDLLNQKLIDPHFCDQKDFISPFARFVPDKEGWSSAIKFAEMLSKEGCDA